MVCPLESLSPQEVMCDFQKHPFACLIPRTPRVVFSVSSAPPATSFTASSSISLGSAATVTLTSPSTSFTASSSISLGSSATVTQGNGIAVASSISLGSAAAVTSTATTIAAASSISLGSAATVTIGSSALTVSAASSISLGSTAAVTIVGPPTSFSAASSISLGSAATVTLTSTAFTVSAASSISLGSAAAVTVTTATTIAAASSISLGAAATVTFTTVEQTRYACPETTKIVARSTVSTQSIDPQFTRIVSRHDPDSGSRSDHIGQDKVYDCELYKSNLPTSAITTYTSSATFTAYFYRGDDQASLFTPTCAWTSATAGTFSVTLPASSTASLAEGTYRLDVFITEGGIKSHAVRASVEVLATAGSGTAPATYCTYEDMLKYAPGSARWSIRPKIRPGSRNSVVRLANGSKTWPTSTTEVSDSSSTAGTGHSRNTWAMTRLSGRDETLQGWFDDDLLILNPDVVEACAKMAIYYVLQGRLAPAQSGNGNQYGAYAAWFAAEAKTIVSTMTLEIDDAGTGTAGTRIDLSVTDTLYA